jgi:hypothetical protein
MEIKLKLEAQDWSERTPTKSQLENHLKDISSYLQAVAGALLATREFTITEGEQNNPVAALLQTAGQAYRASALFGGVHQSGIAVPQPGPVPMQPRR